MEETNTFEVQLESRISALIEQARKRVLTSVNTTMVYTYYEIGRMIVEDEQNGDRRAQYGEELLRSLASSLTAKYGRGFSYVNLTQMRKFYLCYREKIQTVSEEFRFALSWSHYLLLMRIVNPDERSFYEIEAIDGNWSVRELERQRDSALYQRLALSKDKDGVRTLAAKGQIIEKPEDAIKDPYILEFTGLPELPSYSESQLEQKLIDHLQQFLLELGKGFTFVGRQVRFTFEEEHFKVDLVFYNRLLRCFVLFDLKIGKLKHQDIGQMQMYVNYYDRCVKTDDENKTIGVLLCADKNDAVVKMTLPDENDRVFASRYLTYLPTREELEKLIINNAFGDDTIRKIL